MKKGALEVQYGFDANMNMDIPSAGHEREGRNRRNKYGPPPPQKKKEASLTNIPAHYNGNAAMRM